jgi:hypothetical protein
VAGIALLLATGFLAGCTGGAASLPGPAGAKAGSGARTWGTAQGVPGLRPGPANELGAVSCAPGGECTVIGTIGAGGLFAITDRSGSWGTMARIPPGAGSTLALAPKISCPAAGDCTATGISVGSQQTETIVVAREVNGTWGTPSPLPGIPGNLAWDAPPTLSIACAAPGSCAVAGSYAIARRAGCSCGGPSQSFVVEEVNGTWRPAGIPGLQALTRGGDSVLPPLLSCPSPGYCALAGSYPVPGTAETTPGSPGSSQNVPEQGYVASEVNGTWGPAVQVPGAAALTTAAGSIYMSSLSCSAPGDCVAAGDYSTSLASPAPGGAFVVTESGGRWSAATALPGMLSLSVIDCPDAGGCVTAGKDIQGIAAVVRETKRRWGQPAEITGFQALVPPGEPVGSFVTALACPTAATCTAAGEYAIKGPVDPKTGSRPDQFFVAGEVRGAWGAARVPPGMATPTGLSSPQLIGLACAAPGNCAAGGFYPTSLGVPGATFITAEVPAG